MSNRILCLHWFPTAAPDAGMCGKSMYGGAPTSRECLMECPSFDGVKRRETALAVLGCCDGVPEKGERGVSVAAGKPCGCKEVF